MLTGWSPSIQRISHCLGLNGGGQHYIDRALPFGLRSAPKIFSAVADALAWAIHQQGVDMLLHYLDDFFFCSPASAPEKCAQALATALLWCQRLGLPVAPEKLEGPDTTITFLGISIDSINMELRLLPAKLSRLKNSLQWWLTRRNATKHQLESLLGTQLRWYNLHSPPHSGGQTTQASTAADTARQRLYVRYRVVGHLHTGLECAPQ